ncbi:hypothetical protein [Halodurantibacterium flavum]|uniref:Uncharacterized protein n=1 Tax=Halodurantibacterium flavum TaxID=1382802 RepID=A0ABW4S8W4_9RHOB
MNGTFDGKPAGGPSPQRHEAMEKDLGKLERELEEEVEHPEGEFEHPTFPEGEEAKEEDEKRRGGKGLDRDPVYGNG